MAGWPSHAWERPITIERDTMKITEILLAGWIGLGALNATVQAQGIPVPGTPKIQFAETTHDFGTITDVVSVSGAFKFKNIGSGELKMEDPTPSCGCTVAAVKPATLAPDATGDITFTLSLGFYRGVVEKHISVRSNDPLTPEVRLTIKANYRPLYELEPMALKPRLVFGSNDLTQVTTITRTDGKPLQIGRLVGSEPWITATVVSASGTKATNATIRIAIQRQGEPRCFNECVRVYAADRMNDSPVSCIYLNGVVMGEVALSPESLYWSVPEGTKVMGVHPESLGLRRVTIRSASGQMLTLKNPKSTIKGLTVELVQKEPGKVYELVARLGQMPATSVGGNVSFETSVASQPRIEVPVIVDIFTP